MSDDLNKQFEACLEQAKQIVASYRAEAPDGCDPQNSWIAVAGTVISSGVSAYGISQNNKNQKKAMSAQQGQFANAQAYINSLGAEAFGSPLDPSAFLYEPVDITQSQLDTISGNLKAFPSAVKLVDKVNPEIWKNDLARIRQFMPGFDDARDTFIGSTQRLLRGQLPFQDVEDIVSNRSSASAMLGTPGGSRNATLRDLGLSRMSAMGQGANMFQQFIQMAEAVSPVSSQMRPQQMMFTPQERLQADILQRSLEQQGNASAAMAAAMPDPAANAKANATIGLMTAGMNGGMGQGGGGNGAMWGAIAQGVGGAFSAYAGAKQAAPAPLMGGGGGMGLTGGQPISNQSAFPSSYYPPSSVQNVGMGNGVTYKSVGGNTTSSFVPTGTTSSGMSSALFGQTPAYDQPNYLGPYGAGWYR